MTEEERINLKRYFLEKKIISSQVFGDDFIAKVKNAFSKNEYPDDENIISSPEHRAICDECSRYYDFFVGKTWEDCLNDESYRELGGAQSFFTTLGWQYYLPAYLIGLIKRNLFYAGNFEEYTGDYAELIEWQKDKISLLTSEQCEVIVDYLEITLKVWEGISKGDEDDLSPLNFWKENYQKALAKEQSVDK